MRNRRMVLIVVAAVVVLLVYGVYRMATYNPNYVLDVVHANEFTLKSGENVRLIGLDCYPVQEHTLGVPAKEFTDGLIGRRYIRIETDQKQRALDDWLLAYVFVRQGDNEVFLNEELIRRGLAWAAPQDPNVKYRKRFAEAEDEAKRNKLGRWSPDFKPPDR